MTHVSGITSATLENVERRLADVREDVLRLIYSETILVGQSLQSDLKALRVSWRDGRYIIIER